MVPIPNPIILHSATSDVLLRNKTKLAGTVPAWFPVDVPVFPVNYDNCHLMNARNEELCKRAMAGFGVQPRSMSLLS